MYRYLPLFLATAACVDATDDAPPVPADPLACDDLEVRTFRIDAIDLPRDGTGQIAGLDLDHDAAPDNAGARVLDTVFRTYRTEGAEQVWAAQVQARLDGGLTWLVELGSCGRDGAAQVRLRHGVLDGDAVRIVDGEPADGEATSRPATGGRGGNHVHATEGIGVGPLGGLADIVGGGDEAWHAGYGVAAELELGSRDLRGTLGFGFAPPYRAVIGAGFLGWLNDLLALGQTIWGASLDADGDGTITFDELDRDVVFDISMRPDLDLLEDATGAYWPGHDGLDDSFSFGVDVHASEVTVR